MTTPADAIRGWCTSCQLSLSVPVPYRGRETAFYCWACWNVKSAAEPWEPTPEEATDICNRGKYAINRAGILGTGPRQ